jgi:DNA-binding transcriptional regulator YiaG
MRAFVVKTRADVARLEAQLGRATEKVVKLQTTLEVYRGRIFFLRGRVVEVEGNQKRSGNARRLLAELSREREQFAQVRAELQQDRKRDQERDREHFAQQLSAFEARLLKKMAKEMEASRLESSSYEPLDFHFDAKYVENQRARLSLSQEACASLLGVAQGTIIKWEAGSLVPIRLKHLHALAALESLTIEEVGPRLDKLNPVAARRFRHARELLGRFDYLQQPVPIVALREPNPLAAPSQTNAAAAGEGAAQKAEPVSPAPELSGKADIPFGPEYLKHQRRRLFLSQGACASFLGVSAETLTKWESGSLTPSREQHLQALVALEATSSEEVERRLDKLNPVAARKVRRAREAFERYNDFPSKVPIAPVGPDSVAAYVPYAPRKQSRKASGRP